MNKTKIAGVVAAVVSLAFAGSAFAATFSTTLKVGSTGQAVKDLQMVLNSDQATMVAATGVGSAGMESTYFGNLTKMAVIKFQNKYAAEILHPVGLTAGTGIVGPSTRAQLNKMGGTVTSTSTSTTTASSGAVSVMLSATQPMNGSAVVTGQAGATLANLTFSGNGTVSAITLNRGGVSDQSTLTNVYLFDGATRLTDGYSFNNLGTLVMNNVNLAVNGTRTITVKGDVSSSATPGHTISVALGSFTVGGAATTANISGNMLSLVSGSGVLATAALQTASPSPAAATVNAGVTNQNLWSNTISIGTHAAVLKGMTVKMIGSAPSNTLSNVKLFVDGMNVASASINMNNQFVFDLGANAYTMNTGSHTLEVRGDVIGGAYRNFYLSLEKSADIAIYDSQVSGGTVAVTTTYNSSPVTNMLGGLVTINNGTLTINQDTSFNNTTNLVSGATNVKMAAYKFTAYGEDVKVNSLTFNPILSGGFAPVNSGTIGTLQNVGLYINGGQVGSTQTVTDTDVTNGVVNGTITFSSLGSNLIVPVGSPMTVEIRGDVVNSTGATVTAGTVKFDLASGSSNAQGVGSGQLTSTASAGGQTLTVSSTNVTFAQTSGFAASTVAPNQTEKKIGSFTVQTGSAEGITINNILVGITGTMITNNQITNIKVKDGSTVLGTPVGNPTASNNFSVTLPVGVSTTKTLDVYADIGSSAATYTVIPAMTITYRGNTSNVTTTSGAVTGATITANVATIIAGGVTFVPSSSPVAQFVVGGTTGMAIGTFNIKSNNGVAGAMVKDVVVTVPADTISSVTINGVTGQVVGTTATLYNVGITVPADASGINVPATVSLVCVNASGGCSGVSNSNVTAQITSLTYNDGSVVQTISPTAITATHKLVSTKPVVTMSSSNSTGFASGNIKIGEFTIAADAAGDIKIEQIPVTVTISGAATITAGTIELRDASGNTVIVGTGGVNGSAGLSASGNFVFNTASRTITKGTPETFTVYATFAGVTGGSNTMSETFGLDSANKANFLWTDVIGAQTGITGATLHTYPSATQTKSN